ncbi:cyclic di-AMP binding protein CbpA [Ureibacillus composti]
MNLSEYLTYSSNVSLFVAEHVRAFDLRRDEYMLVKQRYVDKKDVVWCKETDSLSEVLDKLNESGYRCIPILDKAGERFIGNAYRVTILEHLIIDFNQDVAISALVLDEEGTISEESSFFEVFFSIKRLPYLAVLNKEGQFSGILTHSKVIELLEEAWGYKTGSCALTISLPDAEGILAKTLTLIKKKWPVHCVFSLDDSGWYLRRIIVTLTKGATQSTVKEIESVLYKVGARLIDVEVFNKENFNK